MKGIIPLLPPVSCSAVVMTVASGLTQFFSRALDVPEKGEFNSSVPFHPLITPKKILNHLFVLFRVRSHIYFLKIKIED